MAARLARGRRGGTGLSRSARAAPAQPGAVRPPGGRAGTRSTDTRVHRPALDTDADQDAARAEDPRQPVAPGVDGFLPPTGLAMTTGIDITNQRPVFALFLQSKWRLARFIVGRGELKTPLGLALNTFSGTRDAYESTGP